MHAKGETSVLYLGKCSVAKTFFYFLVGQGDDLKTKTKTWAHIVQPGCISLNN